MSKMNYRRPQFLRQKKVLDPISKAEPISGLKIRYPKAEAVMMRQKARVQQIAEKYRKPHQQQHIPSPLDNVDWGPWRSVKPVSDAPGAFQNERSGRVTHTT